MTDSEMDRQRQGYFHPEPCILLRAGVTTVAQPNIRPVLAAPGNTANVDPHYLPDVYDNGRVYGIAQYNGGQPPHNLDMGVAAPAHLYYSGMNPSSSAGVFPMPLNHRADQLPGSSTFAVPGVSSDNFGRSTGVVDDVRGPYKRKSAEAIRGNYQYFNPSAGPSTAPPNPRHTDGVTMMDTASFSFPIPSPIMMHDHNHLIHGNYLGQHFHQAAPPWLDQQLNSNNNDGHTTAWNQSLPVHYMQASSVNGSSLESASMGLQRYHDTAGNRNSIRFPHPPPVNQQFHSYHHPALPMPGVRGHTINFHPPVTAAAFRVPANPSRGAAIPPQPGFELVPRHVGPAPPAGFRIYRPQRGVMHETTLGHRTHPPVGFLQVDGVALIDEVGNLVDHHRDMRLDIEDMSYEDLLALGERIGNVSTGLSEEAISNQLKTKTYLAHATSVNEEEAASNDQETDSCMICQDEFKNQEEIGILRCEHEYHAECLRKWLLVKNVCPICKSEALTPGGGDV
ncbi:probable E3 ubiquitin-protein ligase ZFP1 [Lotus japonicus]|uniref:probable E3 ubiquitin-protein ligase ZFP1 n=1 Tax=Lotus japonicus TaxID=34305 RepID=UPI002585767E|nr:probable E3 ubiquitin-protein ligase ZFP1 [Lotus japonicus]